MVTINGIECNNSYEINNNFSNEVLKKMSEIILSKLDVFRSEIEAQNATVSINIDADNLNVSFENIDNDLKNRITSALQH